MAADACLFCSLASGATPADLLYEDEAMVVFRDIHPKAPVHLLIVPKKHIPSVADVTNDDIPLMGAMIHRARLEAEREDIQEKGYRLVFNVGADGGQEVPHVHLHLLGGARLGLRD